MRIIRRASLAPLKNLAISVLGYGAQGRAQALNLRDAGFSPLIGLPKMSRSRVPARRDRMRVVEPREAVLEADLIFVLAPDHVHGNLYKRVLAPHMRSGQMLIFAHASSVHFGLIKPTSKVDVVLIAPMGPGKRLRDLRDQPDGVPCFFSVHQDSSGHARSRGLALAKAIGCIPPGAVDTTFAIEATGDLFGEQAVLCGGLSALLVAGVDTLVRNGHSPATAYLECVYQLDLIVDLIKSEGIAGMFARISPTAAYGAIEAGPKIITPQTRRVMNQLYRNIESGAFFRKWMISAKRKRRPKPALARRFRSGEAAVLKTLGIN